MASIARERGGVNAKAVFAAALAEAQEALVKRLGEAVGAGLEANIELMLGRSAYVRRARIGPWVEVSAVCQRCKCRQSQRFVRNGHRAHRVLTLWGEVTVWVQRVVCVCGGSVQLAMDGWLRPYQRIGDDIDAQVRRWGALRLSLREMQAELAQLHLPPLALRTLNQRLQQVAAIPAATTAATTTAAATTAAATTAAATTPAAVAALPPVLQVDAIWVTQLVPTGTYHRDAKGRRRPDKKRIKRPILIALGVWPDSDRAEVLAWHLADGEDEGAWLAFLSNLEAAGICAANGLELIIHDGGTGLCAALNFVHFGAAEQRCLFHKLRNLYRALRVSGENLSRQEQRRQRKAIFRDFHHIWQAKRLATVLQRYRHVVHLYRLTQPEAVHCLRTDFRATVAYFAVHQRHPHWDMTHLRTTSRLERYNRCLRRRARAASAYHSDAGLQAMLTQEAAAFNSLKPRV